MIDHDKRFIFVHIPKNAGQSIEVCLDGYGKKEHLWGVENGVVLQHLKAREIQETVGDEIFEAYFKFSIVRNPFSKCVSEYFWAIDHLGEELNFPDWVRLKLSDLIKESVNSEEHMKQRHNLEQSKFVYNELDVLIVDHIGRFESLQDDFDTICDRIGLPRQKLPHKNKREHKHYTEYYDDVTRDIVATIYAEDIKRFDYKFEGLRKPL